MVLSKEHVKKEVLPISYPTPFSVSFFNEEEDEEDEDEEDEEEEVAGEDVDTEGLIKEAD
jgi:hypothetical protein